EINAFWLEEPFINLAIEPFKNLSKSSPHVALAGGAGCNNFVQAEAMLKYAGIVLIQIDTSRIGRITTAKRIADLSQKQGITYVNHTFTSNLALSASLQPYAGIKSSVMTEYPVELKVLAREISKEKMLPDTDGYIRVPEKPGLGISVDSYAIRKYLVEVEIKVNNNLIYYTPDL